jgi:hypothetical protein
VGLSEAVALVEGSQVLTRHAPFYLYFVQIWIQFSPWSLLIPVLAIFLWKHRDRVWSSRDSFFLIWFVLLFAGLIFVKYRASRYLLPALPPLALMIGGMGKKKVAWFLIPLSLSILAWHGIEIYWAKDNLSNSPGMVLTGELRPLLKGATLYGYRLDASTLEEVNFHLDRVTPELRRYETLLRVLDRDEQAVVLMPGKLYEKIRRSGNDSIRFLREFQYKEGKLFLVSRTVERHFSGLPRRDLKGFPSFWH